MADETGVFILKENRPDLDHYDVLIVPMHLRDDQTWDYTLYDKYYNHLVGGMIGDGEMAIKEALKEIIKLYDLDVSSAKQIDEELFEDVFEAINADWTSDYQKVYLQELLIDGYDPRNICFENKTIDLTASFYTNEDIDEMRYLSKVAEIPRYLFTEEQWKQIQLGIQDRLPVKIYSDPDLAADQMNFLRKGLIEEEKGDVLLDSIVEIADSKYSVEEMQSAIEYELRRNAYALPEQEVDKTDWRNWHVGDQIQYSWNDFDGAGTLIGTVSDVDEERAIVVADDISMWVDDDTADSFEYVNESTDDNNDTNSIML